MNMDGRVKEIDRAVKGYDKYLFAKRLGDGAVQLYRKNPNNSAAPYSYIMSLTDTWTMNGKPREWGLEVIVSRLKAHDLWKDETVVDRLEKEMEKSAQANERSLKNNIESFLYDFRRQFARATNDVNTSSMDKIEPRALVGA